MSFTFSVGSLAVAALKSAAHHSHKLISPSDSRGGDKFSHSVTHTLPCLAQAFARIHTVVTVVCLTER